MKIKITFTGKVVFDNIKNGDPIEIEKGSTISDLYSKFEVKTEFHHFIVPFIDKIPKELDYVIQEGDELDLYVPVSGG